MQNIVLKWIKKFLWVISIIIFICGSILLVFYLTGVVSKNILGLIALSVSFILILCAFIIDSVEVMILKETAGDEYNTKSKEALILLIKKRSLYYEKEKPKSYYLELLRKDDEKRRNND